MLLEFAEAFGSSPSEGRTALSAVDHKLQFWDALIPTAAADAGCTLLLSGDMQHGFIARGLTVINPLASDIILEWLPCSCRRNNSRAGAPCRTARRASDRGDHHAGDPGGDHLCARS